MASGKGHVEHDRQGMKMLIRTVIAIADRSGMIQRTPMAAEADVMLAHFYALMHGM